MKLLVSGKLKAIIESRRKTGLQFFNAPLIYKNKQIDDYWILHSHEIDMNAIDFKQSVVFKTRNFVKNVEELTVSSYDDFIAQKAAIESMGTPNGIRIVKFSTREDFTLDFFTLTDVEGGVKYLVSENLKL